MSSDESESEYWDFSPEPTESQMESQMESNFMFITALDERVCPQCGPLDSQVFTASEAEINFPNATELFPGTVAANVHINCRCQLVSEPIDEGVMEPLGELSAEEY